MITPVPQVGLPRLDLRPESQSHDPTVGGSHRAGQGRWRGRQTPGANSATPVGTVGQEPTPRRGVVLTGSGTEGSSDGTDGQGRLPDGSRWSPTPTGTASGTSPSRPSGSSWSVSSTACSTRWSGTARTPTSSSTGSWPSSTTTSRSGPRTEDRLEDLAAAGRITLGPWYILMDEFLVSGETIVRNLQAGIRRGSAFGGVMEVGYLPDMFGHVAQMPQLLSLAGFEHAVVWRGVPSAVDRTRVPLARSRRIERPGRVPGGRVRQRSRAPRGRQGAGATAPAPSTRSSQPFLGPDDPLLLMNGTDHQRPQPWLGRVVAEANQIQSEFELTISSLPDYLAGAPDTGLPDWHGELRSGARSNLLMGVASNRVDVKQAAARAERALERMAEPLSALFLAAGRLAGSVSGGGLDPDDPQRRPRLDLRLLGRRRGGRRPAPLRRGPPHRCRAWPTRPWPRWRRPWPPPDRWWSIRRAAHAERHGRGGGDRGR